MKHVIEMMMPDGPHWYAGIRTNEKDGKTVQGPEWSPYWEDRKVFNREQAVVTYNTICHSLPGASVIEEDYALKADAWKLVSPTEYLIRVKYLSKDLLVMLPGHMTVCRVTNSMKSAVSFIDKYGNRHTINKKAKTWIRVVGKAGKKEGEA
jgi:hypothetical protein